ncbi:MAG: glycosyltransferase [Candidatus Coatesbacteria bacterium]|nr:MAG: glycosyltransferase [Candidatus Coatesbacteria bacterium]
MPSPKPKALVVSTTFPLGAEDKRTARFVYDLADALAEYFDVWALAPHHPGAARRERLGRVNVVRFRYFLPASAQRLADGRGMMANFREGLLPKLQAPFLFLFLFLNVWYWGRKLKPALVNPHWVLPAGLCVAAARPPGKRILMCHAAGVFLLKRLPLRRFVGRFTVNAMDRVFTSSRFIAESLDEAGEIKSGAVRVGPGVRASNFARQVSRVDAKEELGYDVNEPLLLFVGRMVEKKGITYLIDAMPDAVASFPDVKLVLVGGGPLQEEMSAKTRAAGLEKNVVFAGYKSHDELREYLWAADYLVVPSVVDASGETEGMPTVILEAFAAGCPAVGSRVDGIPELINEGETGFLCETRDAGSLADALTRALSTDPGPLGEKAAEIAKRYDFSAVAEIYRDAVMEGDGK